MHLDIQRRVPLSTLNVRPPTFLSTQRRSQRILLTVPVIITGALPTGAPFSERAKTRIVNAHGALVLLNQTVVLGQLLKVRNVATGEEQACKVVDINAGQEEGKEVGVEFTQPSPRFWCVAFPPADWSPRSPEAKRFVSHPAEKK